MITDNKNLVLAIVLSVSILLAYQMFFEGPRREKQLAEQQAVQQQQAAQQQTTQQQDGQPQSGRPQTGQAPVQPGAAAPQVGAAPQLGVDTAGIGGGVDTAEAR